MEPCQPSLKILGGSVSEKPTTHPLAEDRASVDRLSRGYVRVQSQPFLQANAFDEVASALLKACYRNGMTNSKIQLLLFLVVPAIFVGQVPSEKSATPEPLLPVIDYKACPFEGCTFGKWIVTRDSTIFSTWKEGRKPVATLQKGQVVTGLTGVHITYEPDRVRVFQPIPELQLQPGDTILRYMYRGEGFADIWIKGQMRKQYDCTFITEKDNSGCLQDCPAKVISDGRKDWWVRLKTSQGLIGWAKVEDQFDCMDSLGGDPKCDNL